MATTAVGTTTVTGGVPCHPGGLLMPHVHRQSRTLRQNRTVADGALIAAAVLAFAMAASVVTASPVTASPVTARPASSATIVGEGAQGSIKDRYIVVFRDAATATRPASSAAGELARRYGGTVLRSYASSIRGYSARLTSAAARRVAADPSVAYVEQDRVVSLTSTQSDPPWGVDRIDQRALPLSRSYAYQGTTSNVTAYILDTGILVGHSDFGDRASNGRDFIDNDAIANDCNGHGTHVAGTVGGARYGVAKEVKLVGVRVLNCAGSGSYSQIIAGIDWVTRNAVKPAVANMSLGGGASVALDDALRRSIASGVTYAVAAGNENANACGKSPARTAEAITVGATDSYDRRASFSNYGSCVDMFAPGVRILSTASSGGTATATMSGTSMAAPHAAGVAAVYLAGNPSASPAQVHGALVNTATAGKVTDSGSDSPNRLLYSGQLT